MAVSVNVNVADPGLSPVTFPDASIDATAVALDVHVPPLAGRYCVWLPVQICDGPSNIADGLAMTETGVEGKEEQPVVEDVNTNVAEP